MQYKRYHPEAIVSFYTETSNLVVRASADPNANIDDDVISVHTYRDMGADAPTFSVNLTRRKPWHKWLGSNDLVVIHMHRPPEKIGVVFVGLIDDVRKNTVMSDDNINRVITVSGRGVAKAFIRFDIGVVPEAEYASTHAGWLITHGVNISGGTPTIIISALWEMIARKFINYTWKDGKKLFDIIKYKVSNRPNLVLTDDSNLINWQGSIFSFIKEVAESPFYECFWEIEDSTPTLVVRPTPFSKNEWNSLPKVTITDEDVVVEQVGISDVETYTIYSVGSKTLFSSQDSYKTFGYMPLWYEPYSKKYGINRLHVESAYMSVAEHLDARSTDVMHQLQKDLFNWNIKNNSMINGAFMLKGSNQYKIGTKLEYTSEEDQSVTQYYITAVRQNFINFQSWGTEVTVTRGMDEKNRFTPPYDCPTEYRGMGLTKFDPSMAKASLQGGLQTLYPINGVWLDKATQIISQAELLMDTNAVTFVSGVDDMEHGRADCSSFVHYMYQKYGGIDIGRTTFGMDSYGTAITDKSKLSPGDIVLFQNTDPDVRSGPSHVGIYIGDNQFIHNSTSVGGLTISYLTLDYWVQHWYKGRRVLQSVSMADLLNKKFGGLGLNGYGQAFVDACTQYNVDVVLAAAICMHETGNGTSDASIHKHNVGGMMGENGLMTFSTTRDGIFAMVRNLYNNYISQGLTTIELIQPKYAPLNADNDPTNLNSYWVDGVVYYYNYIMKG